MAPPCEVDAYDQQTGEAIWTHNYGCTGGGGFTAAVNANNIFFAPDIGSNRIFNALTGQLLGTFPGITLPVVGATYAYIRPGTSLQSVTISNQQVNWTFQGDSTLSTPAIAVDNTVFVGASSGNVYAVDALTGNQLWVVSAGSQIGNGVAPAGPGAADGYLVVPTATGLLAWKIVP